MGVNISACGQTQVVVWFGYGLKLPGLHGLEAWSLMWDVEAVRGRD
jgi:hypothetical protein